MLVWGLGMDSSSRSLMVFFLYSSRGRFSIAIRRRRPHRRRRRLCSLQVSGSKSSGPVLASDEEPTTCRMIASLKALYNTI